MTNIKERISKAIDNTKTLVPDEWKNFKFLLSFSSPTYRGKIFLNHTPETLERFLLEADWVEIQPSKIKYMSGCFLANGIVGFKPYKSLNVLPVNIKLKLISTVKEDGIVYSLETLTSSIWGDMTDSISLILTNIGSGHELVMDIVPGDIREYEHKHYCLKSDEIKMDNLADDLDINSRRTTYISVEKALEMGFSATKVTLE